MNRRWRKLRRDTNIPIVLPVPHDSLFDGPIEQGIGVLPVIVKVRQPDVVVKAGGLPRHAMGVKADESRHLLDAIMSVAQAADLDTRLTPHKRRPFKDRVAGLKDPRTRANPLHIPRHIQHQLKIVVFREAGARIEIAVLCRQFTATLHKVLVVRDGGRVDDEIGVLQRLRAVQRALEPQTRPQILNVALSKAVDHVEPFLVDVHQRDRAVPEALCQAQVLDQTQGEDHTPSTDNGDFNIGHRRSLQRNRS